MRCDITETAKILKRMEVPDWALDKTLLTYDVNLNNDGSVVEDIRRATDSRRNIGIICKQSGRGKTHLAVGALGRACWSHRGNAWDYLFTRADSAIRRIETAGIRLDEVMEHYTDREALVLDEVGRGFERGEYSKAVFQMLVGEAYDKGVHLIWTSPFEWLELKGLIDGATISRLEGRGTGLIIQLREGKRYKISQPDEVKLF